MRSETEYLWFETKKHREFLRITDDVAKVVARSKVKEGFCLVSAMHITSGIWVNDEESGLKHDVMEWLERLAPGASAWNEEQSRKNFEMASLLVNPGDSTTSRLLQQPLAPEAGGNVFHSGGRQFASTNDPAWKTLADWVNGQKL